MHSSSRFCIVPPYLLRHLAAHADDAVATRARASLLLDDTHRRRRTAAGVAPTRPPTSSVDATGPVGPPGPRRTISDVRGGTALPGDVVRTEGAAPTGDAAADEAYDGLGATWALFHDSYGRDSLDGAGLPLDASVHFGRDYDNAFWDGSRMVFGDGDGRIFGRFTVAVDVIGHELAHGVTEMTAGLVYQGQSGALNESLSDVFGALVKQRLIGQRAADADWLIGAGLFLPSVRGSALRSMKAPGTAYDDPVLGRDPQPATMADYVQTDDDNGGVHINSGIPNHAFYLAATGIGGFAAEGAGQVWYDVLTGGQLAADADFAAFAGLTTLAAASRFGPGSAQQQAVAAAWQQVGVAVGAVSTSPSQPTPVPAPAPSSPPSSPPSCPAGPAGPASGLLLVQRTGGFAGLRLEREIELESLPREQSEQWQALLRSGLLLALPEPQSAPDRYVYRVCCPAVDLDVRAGEQHLPPAVLDTFEQTLHLP